MLLHVVDIAVAPRSAKPIVETHDDKERVIKTAATAGQATFTTTVFGAGCRVSAGAVAVTMSHQVEVDQRGMAAATHDDNDPKVHDANGLQRQLLTCGSCSAPSGRRRVATGASLRGRTWPRSKTSAVCCEI